MTATSTPEDDPLAKPLKLPCGAVLPNRLCKSAMTEGLADDLNRATPELCHLYDRWAAGGSGLLITGNVQLDRRFMERPGNVAIDGPQDDEQMARLQRWAAAATANGTHCWVQLAHAGRQCDIKVCKEGVGPSAVASKNLSGWKSLLPSYPPRPLETDEVAALPARFAAAAVVCKEAGFTGVQLHSAHGYLLSSFLNPNANQRTDRFGGELENRARLLLECATAVRQAVGPTFAVAVKLNSSDFQQGGFTHDEAAEVAALLDRTGALDLIEASGGNYENLAVLGGPKGLNRRSTAREAYFLKYTHGMKKALKRTPLMVTGGFRSRECIEAALLDGCCEVVGLGRPLCAMPDGPKRLFERRIDALPRYEDTMDLPWGLRWIVRWQLGRIVRTCATQQWYYVNEIRMGKQKPTDEEGKMSIIGCFLWMSEFDKKCARNLRDLTCEGTVLNAKTNLAVVAAAVLVLAAGLLLATRSFAS